jgi:uncharacterized membrane protein
MTTRHATRATVSLGVILACVIGTMSLGIALKAPCASGDWGDQRQYRFLCYSDVIPLLGTEQLFTQGGRHVGRLPFLDACEPVQGQNCDEYPVLTMWFIRVAGWISGDGYTAFFSVNALMLLGCAVAIAVCLSIMNGARALYFALAPTLLVYGTMNWDLLAVAFATAGMLLFFRRRDTGAGALMGLGAAAKLFPGLLAVPLIFQRLRERAPDRAIKIAWSTAGAWVVVNLPFALAAFGAWWTFFRFNGARGADFDSLWYIVCRDLHIGGLDLCFSTRTVNVASLVAFIVLFALVWAIKVRHEPAFARWTLGFPLLVAFLVTNKVYSPQYGLWLLPWFALALPRAREWVLFETADVAVFVTRFWFFGQYEGGWGVPEWLFETMVLLRLAALIWCVVVWIRDEAEPLEIEGRARPEPALAHGPIEPEANRA